MPIASHTQAVAHALGALGVQVLAATALDLGARSVVIASINWRDIDRIGGRPAKDQRSIVLDGEDAGRKFRVFAVPMRS